MIKKRIILLFTSIFMLFSVNATPYGIGADAAYPIIVEILKTFPYEKNTLYELSDDEMEVLIVKSSEIKINIFELLDCSYRYLKENNFRAKIYGSSLTRLTNTYRITHDVLAQVLQLDKIDYIEVGAALSTDQNPLDIYLFEGYSVNLDVGLTSLDSHFGFKKMKPNLFYEAFGLNVKVWGLKKQFSKVELYEPGNAAFYVKNFFIPKKYYLHLIIKKNT